MRNNFKFSLTTTTQILPKAFGLGKPCWISPSQHHLRCQCLLFPRAQSRLGEVWIFKANARSDGVLVVRVPARSDRGRPRLPPWDQRPPGGHHRCWGENKKVVVKNVFTTTTTSTTSILTTTNHRLIMIDAFRYAGRALGVQLGAHIKTQVEHFSNLLGS